MQACILVWMDPQAGTNCLFLSLSLWRVSGGVCIQPLPWRYRPQMQLTRIPSCLYLSPPPRSSLQRWPFWSLDRCHEASAGPPLHKSSTINCYSLLHFFLNIQFIKAKHKTLVSTCRERAVLGGTLATRPCSFLFLNLRKYSWMRKVA